MPSPFPGMDPFLEHALLWPTLQQHLVNSLAEKLAEVLPRRYRVDVRERVYAEGPDLEIFPAGSPTARDCRVSLNGKPHLNGKSAADSCWHIALAPEEVREGHVVITLTDTPERVVTAIEVLTQANKTPGSVGRLQYRASQRAALTNCTHLLEIDLLRGGQHTVAAPHGRLLRRGSFDYLVCLSRSGQREFCEVWGIPLEQRLPCVPVPLLSEDADVTLDLQTLVAACVVAASCSRWIDYEAEPHLPLSRKQQWWVEQVLREHETNV